MRISILSFVLSLLTFLLTAQVADTTQARSYFEQADSLALAANYSNAKEQVETAIDIYEEIATHRPELAAAYSLLGNTFLELGQLEAAKQTFSKALDFCEVTFGEIHPASAQTYNDFGNYELEQDNRTTALQYFRQSLAIREKVLPKQHPDIADSYNNLGNIAFLNTDYTVAKRHYNKALTIRKVTLGEEHLDVASSFFNLGNCAFHELELKTAFDFYQQALAIRGKELGKQHPDCGKTLLMLGRCLEANGSWEEAIQYYTQSKLIFDTASETQNSNKAYANDYIGSCYAQLGRNKQALEYHVEALAIREAIYNKAHPVLGESWNNIGNVYFHLGDFGRAMQYYQQAVLNLERTNQTKLAATYENLGICYRYQKKYQESIAYLSKALASKTPNSPETATTYINIGNVYADIQQYTQARRYYEESAKLLQNTSNPDLISATNNIGICYFEEGAFSDALGYFQQALILSNSTYGADAIPSVEYLKNIAISERELDNPEEALTYLNQAIAVLSDGRVGDWSQVEAPIELLSVLDAKARTLYEEYTPKAAAETYELALDLLDHLRIYYHDKNSRQKLNEYNLSLFEGALATYFNLAEKEGIEHYADNIFNILEKSKSLLLLDALLKSEATMLGGIPDSLIAQERQLLERINELEQTRYHSQKAELTQLNAAISQTKQRHDELVVTFERNYPKYHQLKYSSEPVALTDVQENLLQDGQTMLEYFVGEKVIFVLLIQADKTQFFRIEKNFPLEKWIFNIHDAVSKYFVSGNASAKVYNEVYITFAHRLYERLFPEALQAQLSEQLILIPDGALGYLPFDLLLTNIPKDSTRFKNFDYFLKQHQVSYAYSPTLLYATKTRKTKRAKKQFLGIAPGFKHPDLQLNPLAHNTKEVQALSDLFQSKILLDTAATSNNFLALAPDYRILHLATHGLADNRVGQFSYIAFSNDSTSTTNDLLYVNDLYNTQLHADMVVLSACETALGEFQKGEGIISLARGFSYAGARSVITTLWSIDDKNTSELMQSFYKNLKENLPKDAALRQAKLTMLEGTQEAAHPYYWAAFIPLGDMSVLSVAWNWWWILGGILLVLLISRLAYWRFR